ncbi:hypothetical protein MTO96_036092 [Rhipicephalus appendiculatus]
MGFPGEGGGSSSESSELGMPPWSRQRSRWRSQECLVHQVWVLPWAPVLPSGGPWGGGIEGAGGSTGPMGGSGGGVNGRAGQPSEPPFPGLRGMGSGFGGGSFGGASTNGGGFGGIRFGGLGGEGSSVEEGTGRSPSGPRVGSGGGFSGEAGQPARTNFGGVGGNGFGGGGLGGAGFGGGRFGGGGLWWWLSAAPLQVVVMVGPTCPHGHLRREECRDELQEGSAARKIRKRKPWALQSEAPLAQLLMVLLEPDSEYFKEPGLVGGWNAEADASCCVCHEQQET